MPSPDVQPVLEVRGLSVSFGSRQILSGIDLALEPGTIISILGPNGSGKTTMLRALAGLDPFPGQQTHGIVTRTVPYAFVHQHYEASLLPWYTAERNILLAPCLANNNRLTSSDLMRVLDDFGLAARLPLDRRPEQLSGGQRQMIALVRALVLGRQLLFLDEPFAALDRTAQSNFAASLRRLAKLNRWVVVAVLHDIHLAAFLADQCIPLIQAPSVLGTPVTIAHSPNERMIDFIRDPQVVQATQQLAAELYSERKGTHANQRHNTR